jgi:hypothetical protein
VRARRDVIRPLRGVARGGRLLLLGVLVGLFVASAQAAPSTKFYSATVVPDTVEANSIVTFTVTLTNSNTSPNVSTQSLGSANVTVPAGFTGITSVIASTPAGKTWTANYVAPNVEFRAASVASAIAPGQSVSATVTATAPSAAGDYTWLTQAKQSNSFSGPPGNAFIRVGSDPVVTVVGRLCRSDQPTCLLSSGNTTAETAPPTGDATIEMTLLSDEDFICNGQTVPVGLILLINAPSATADYTVTLTYMGVTGNVSVCKSNDGVTYELLSDCGPSQGAPCVESNAGNPRVVVIRLAPGDPYVGGS